MKFNLISYISKGINVSMKKLYLYEILKIISIIIFKEFNHIYKL